MNHTLQHVNAFTLSEGGSGPFCDDRGRQTTADEFGAAYDAHAQPLYSLAQLLCEDDHTADEVFVRAMTRLAALPLAIAGDPCAQRRRLAAELFRAACSPDGPRRHSNTAQRRHRARKRDAPTRNPRTDPHVPPCGRRQALLGLTLLGGHTYDQAAALLDLDPSLAAHHLHEALRPPLEERHAG
ncbi:hypothetical protein AB0C89_36925 [Streptomyces sp. NPDC048491]|uniref:hypothetical protein n=1 Tax=Streptomyces sp. NPDC048491 TaxID=3157207 RepID=UPI00342A7838